jgi:hypothetical protein
VDVDELPVDAECNQHIAVAVDAIPLAAIAAFRKYLGEFGSRPCLGIAVTVDIVDPRAAYPADILSYFIFVLLADLRVPAWELRSLFGEGRT